jgi:hypothetical protein
MDAQQIQRPYIRVSTDSLRDMVIQNSSNFTLLANIFVELLFRKRPIATELRAIVVQQMLEILPNYFPWPSTDTTDGMGELDESFFQHQQGVLGLVGYRVGVSGIDASRRQGLLDFVYSNNLPPINSAEYMAEWGKPNSALRLEKMAESVAAFTRNFKRRKSVRFSTAISEWETDLAYLKATYYIGRYNFLWPRIEA